MHAARLVACFSLAEGMHQKLEVRYCTDLSLSGMSSVHAEDGVLGMLELLRVANESEYLRGRLLLGKMDVGEMAREREEERQTDRQSAFQVSKRFGLSATCIISPSFSELASSRFFSILDRLDGRAFPRQNNTPKLGPVP